MTLKFERQGNCGTVLGSVGYEGWAVGIRRRLSLMVISDMLSSPRAGMIDGGGVS